MHQVLKYPGSKWRIAEWIISQFPEHHSYLEPFFGSGAVLFSKAPSKIETINDLDNKVCDLFKLIRDNPDILARKVLETPYSRTEYDKSFEFNENDDLVELSRKFLIQCWQGHGFRTNGYKVGWKNDVQGREKAYAVSNWNRLPDWIMEITGRLKNIQIENRAALELIKRFKYKNVLIYADPPYILGTRTGKQYKYEMSDQDHVELLETLLQHPGPVILSGYQNEMYDFNLKDWNKNTIQSNAEYYQGKNRMEVIWMNFKPPAEQLSLII
jgi:DNA adenine methylase